MRYINLRLLTYLADWPNSVIVLATVSGGSAAEPPGPQVSQMCPPRYKLQPREIYASGGDVLVAPISMHGTLAMPSPARKGH